MSGLFDRHKSWKFIGWPRSLRRLESRTQRPKFRYLCKTHTVQKGDQILRGKQSRGAASFTGRSRSPALGMGLTASDVHFFSSLYACSHCFCRANKSSNITSHGKIKHFSGWIAMIRTRAFGGTTVLGLLSFYRSNALSRVLFYYYAPAP